MKELEPDVTNQTQYVAEYDYGREDPYFSTINILYKLGDVYVARLLIDKLGNRLKIQGISPQQLADKFRDIIASCSLNRSKLVKEDYYPNFYTWRLRAGQIQSKCLILIDADRYGIERISIFGLGIAITIGGDKFTSVEFNEICTEAKRIRKVDNKREPADGMTIRDIIAAKK